MPSTRASRPPRYGRRRLTAFIAALVTAAGTAQMVAPAAQAAISPVSPTFSRTTTNITDVMNSSLIDVDNDGDLDMVNAVWHTGFVVGLNNGGAFSFGAVTPVGNAGYTVAVGRFDADAYVDIILATDTGLAYTFFGVGDGTFTAGAVTAITSNQAGAAVAGDFNGDGLLDVAIAGSPLAIGYYSVGPTGTLSLLSTTAVPSFRSVQSIYAADFNKDGIDDVTFGSTQWTTVGVSVQMSTGSGSTHTHMATPAYAYDGLAIADFNGDGYPDIAYNGGTSIGGGTIGVLAFTPASGTFTNVVALNTSGFGVSAGDFNGDGTVDIAAPVGNRTKLLLNDGTMTFALGATDYYGTGYDQHAADLTGDGKVDILVNTWNSSYTLLTNTTSPSAPSITIQPSNTSVAPGSTATFSANAAGLPTPTVQWQSSPDGTTYTNITDATSTTLTLNTVTTAQSGMRYRAVFSNTTGPSATTTAATLTVTEAPAVTAQPSDSTVTAGGTATFTAAASGIPAPTVQWQSSPDGTTYTNITDATSTTLTLSPVTGSQNGTRYRALFTNSAGTATTTAATLTVTEAPAVTTQPSDSTVTAGGTATFSAAASGTPTPTVQWQSSPDGTTYTSITDATSTTLTLSPVTGSQNGTRYRALFTNSTGTATTTAATLTINEAPAVTAQPVDTTAAAGATATFTATASGLPAPTVQWQSSPDGTTYTNITDATSTTLTLNTVT
ncbi:MAG: hypothetical protein JWM93_1044, partial [Frankiales bacterium]|nr:hypothetical protein [Frankiales bacterium]